MVDSQLPSQLEHYLSILFLILGGIVTISIITPYYLIPIPFFGRLPFPPPPVFLILPSQTPHVHKCECVHWFKCLKKTTSVPPSLPSKTLSLSLSPFLSTPPQRLDTPFAVFFFWLIQRYYIPCARDLQRLEAVSKSPLFSHFFGTTGKSMTVSPPSS